MKLSKLVYQCIKNVVYSDDTSFSYAEFLKGTFNNSADYATNINNVFAPLNEAIARLSDLERIPYRVEACNVVDNIIDLNYCIYPVKEVISVAQRVYVRFIKLDHKPFGLDKVYVNDCPPYGYTYIEYKEDIPMFDETYYSYAANDEDVVDLKNYGITDSMCNYIIEYVMGKLYEPISAEVANMHITRAEQYFVNIKPTTSAFAQQTVKTVFMVGE